MSHFASLLADILENRVFLQREFEAASNRLTAAIGGNALHIVYQRIVDLATHETLGFEALSRFQCAPARGPDQWFEEAHGLSRGVELELLAVELAIRNMDAFPANTYISVNVSPQTILSGLLADILPSAAPGRLVLEITEHVPIEEYDGLAQALAPLREAGARLAIDDAGSGYASFRHILQLHPDIIKLDRSLIRNIHLDSGQRALASALIAFAKDTGSRVVAEGVETQDELDVLQDLGADAAQGYLLGRPAPCR